MAIPKNITKEHLLKAISKIDNEGIPKDGDSKYYEIRYLYDAIRVFVDLRKSNENHIILRSNYTIDDLLK